MAQLASVVNSVKIDFGGEFPTIVEYNALSLASTLDAGNDELFTSATMFLPKQTAKRVQRRFRFLKAMRIQSVPIGQHDVEEGFDLRRRNFFSVKSLSIS